MNVEDSAPAEPQVFTLSQNAPNPFNQATAIRFELFRAGDARLTIYDLLGRIVAEPASGWFAAGAHNVAWDGRDESGAPVSSGIYIPTRGSRKVGVGTNDRAEVRIIVTHE